MPEIFRDGKYEDVSMDRVVQWHIDALNSLPPGCTIQTIKAMREITGVCLKDAKDLVVAIQRHAITPLPVVAKPSITQSDLDDYVEACNAAAAAWKAEDGLAFRMAKARNRTNETHNEKKKLAARIIAR